MTEVPPRSAETIAVDATTVLPWEEARTRLADARTYWMTTMRPDGAPHVRPVLAVWTDGALHSTSSPVARKGRNLARDARAAPSRSEPTYSISSSRVA